MCQRVFYDYGFGDANAELLPDGRVLQGVVDSDMSILCYIYDPVTNTYTRTGNCRGYDQEETWLKLPDNSILLVDHYGNVSQRYVPDSGKWIGDARLPNFLYDDHDGECGGAFLLPDGFSFP